MNLIKKSGLVLILAIISVTGAVSCSTEKTVYPPDYSISKTQLADANTQIASLQTQIDQFQKQIGDLEKQVADKSGDADNITKLYNALTSQYQNLSAQNESNLATITDLQTKYQELKSKYDLLTQPTATVNETNVAQALMDALNKDRTANGLPVFLKGTNIIPQAKVDNLNMAQAKAYLVDAHIPFQQEFIMTGYSSVDGFVNATMAIWKNNQQWYDANVLAVDAVYGTVDVYLADNIFYITFLASNYP